MKLFLPIIIFLLLLIPSCRDSVKNPQILKAQQIVEQNPDSALSILNSINPEKLQNDDERMLRRLLILEANDLNYVEQENDEEIKALLHYFIDNNRLKKLHPLVYYYAGRTYFDLNQYSKSVLYFRKAIKSIPKSGDLYLERRIHSQLGDLFLKNKLYMHALREMKMYAQLSDSIATLNNSPENKRDYLNAAIIVGSVYRHAGKLDSALFIYEKLEPTVIQSNDSIILSHYIAEKALYYLYNDEPDKADSIVRSHPFKYDKLSKNFLIITQAEIEKRKIHPRYDTNKLKEVLNSGSLLEKFNAANKLAENADRNNDFHNLRIYASEAYTISKKIYKIRNNESIGEMEKIIDETELENDNLALSNKNQSQKIIILIVSICALLCILLVAVLYLKTKLRNTQLVLEIEKMKNENQKAAFTKQHTQNQFAIAEMAEEITRLIISSDEDLSEQHFTKLNELLLSTYPNFIETINRFNLKTPDYKDAMLIKINVPQKVCAAYLRLSPSGLSNIRKRLFDKYCLNTTFKNWKEFIQSL